MTVTKPKPSTLRQKVKMQSKGHSQYIYIPTAMIRALNAQKGDEMELELRDDGILMRPVQDLTLKALLASVPADYQPRKSEEWSEDEIMEAME
jgi:antitoxin component of MazEF toxin-antitoxin module